jgi:hypothetical protein
VRLAVSANDFLDASHDSVIQHHFYSVRMSRRLRQDLFHDSFRQLSRALILFFDDTYFHAWLNRGSGAAIHHLDMLTTS